MKNVKALILLKTLSRVIESKKMIDNYFNLHVAYLTVTARKIQSLDQHNRQSRDENVFTQLKSFVKFSSTIFALFLNLFTL